MAGCSEIARPVGFPRVFEPGLLTRLNGPEMLTHGMSCLNSCKSKQFHKTIIRRHSGKPHIQVKPTQGNNTLYTLWNSTDMLISACRKAAKQFWITKLDIEDESTHGTIQQIFDIPIRSFPVFGASLNQMKARSMRNNENKHN